MATLRQTWTKKNCQLKEGTARDAVWAVGEQKYAPFELRWDDFCIPYQSAFHAILCSCLLWLMWGGLEYHDNLAWAPASDKTLSLYNTRGSPAVAPSSSKSSYAASCRILQNPPLVVNQLRFMHRPMSGAFQGVLSTQNNFYTLKEEVDFFPPAFLLSK